MDLFSYPLRLEEEELKGLLPIRMVIMRDIKGLTKAKVVNLTVCGQSILCF